MNPLPLETHFQHICFEHERAVKRAAQLYEVKQVLGSPESGKKLLHKAQQLGLLLPRSPRAKRTWL